MSTALSRFQKEDPTFRVGYDRESEEVSHAHFCWPSWVDLLGYLLQTLIAGMGELHLEIYVERLRREYGLDVEVGAPQVNYRCATSRPARPRPD